MKALELNQMEQIHGGSCNGQRTIDCISSAYTQQGWFSVVLWVGTLVDPGVGVAAAAGCAAGGCLT